MADLTILLPNHGYSADDPIFVSWLDTTISYYVRAIDTNSFKISTVINSDAGIVSYTTEVTSGYVRETAGIAGVASIGGLDHLEGQTVYLVSGGILVGSYAVSSGVITVPSSVYTNYVVGLPFVSKIKTMRFSVPTAAGTSQSRIKRISESTVRYLKSQGGQAGQEYNGTEYLQDLDAEFSLESKDKSILTDGGFSPDGFTVVKSSVAKPFTILATVVEVETWEQ